MNVAIMDRRIWHSIANKRKEKHQIEQMDCNSKFEKETIAKRGANITYHEKRSRTDQ